MKADYVHKDTLTVTDYVDLQKENELIISYNQQLLKENEDLKRQLEEYKENYQEELDENSKLSELWCDSRAKIRELERQLEELDKKLFFTKNELDMRQKSIDNKLNQQKEFIKWLEDYLNLFDYRDIQEQAIYDMLEEILQKYRSIIGCDKVE